MAEPQVVAATKDNCSYIAGEGDGGCCQQCGEPCPIEHIHIISSGGVPSGVCSEGCAIQVMRLLEELRDET